LSYTLLSVLWRTWRVSCPILCYRCYRELGRLVVVYFVIDVIDDLEGSLSYTFLSMLLRIWRISCPILCYLCYGGLGGLVVVYFAIDVIEDLEG
jgi:hypothetical protein